MRIIQTKMKENIKIEEKYVFMKDREEWKDVKPISFDDNNSLDICKINFSEECIKLS